MRRAVREVAVSEVVLLDTVEVLRFVAEWCTCEAPLVSAALARFVNHASWDAGELCSEALCCADRLAQVMGFPDADMDPGKPRPRRTR